MTNKYMYFVANWKMFGGLKTLNSLNRVISFSNNIKKSRSKIIYCPPTTLILPVFQKFKETSIEVGAQNCHESKKYASLTGQINSKMLKEVGAKYVILGHSENRQTGEDNKLINKKIKSSLMSGLKVIFCIGEPSNMKDDESTKSHLKDQLSVLKNTDLDAITIAYEPIWAIGTGLNAGIKHIESIHSFIKVYLNTLNTNKNISVVYGGSVKLDNSEEILSSNNVDGLLIGGASLDSDTFSKIYNLS